MAVAPAPALEIRGVVDAAAEHLRESIISGSLPPGTAVTESLISEQYAIARPSAKAAIEKVVSEGLLERTAHRSARVRELDSASVRDIYRTRRHLEGAALRDLATRRLVPSDAEAANDEIRHLDPQHPAAIVQPDLRFHLAIVDALESPRMSAIYHGLASEVRFCMSQVQGRHLLETDLICAEHDGLLAALRSGDGEGAVELLRVHLQRAERRLIAALAEQN